MTYIASSTYLVYTYNVIIYITFYYINTSNKGIYDRDQWYIEKETFTLGYTHLQFV